MKINRRALMRDAAFGALGLGLAPSLANAGPAPKSPPALDLSVGKELQSILDQNARVFPDAPRSSELAAPRNTLELSRNLGGLLDRALEKAAARNQDAAELADRIGNFLSQINRANRDGVADELRGPTPTLTPQLRAEYRQLFDSCQVSADHRSEIGAAVKRIASPDYVRKYKVVSTDTGVPWYVIGALHYREASLNFLGHLHNGDFLKRKTVDVPAGRPPGDWPPNPWDAEQAWRISAQDALSRYRNQNWNLEDMLFMFELYNGWGYRSHPGYRSPYLWSFTQLYKRGGFPRDHVWSDTYVSRQAGLAAILKALVELPGNGVVIPRSG